LDKLQGVHIGGSSSSKMSVPSDLTV